MDREWKKYKTSKIDGVVAQLGAATILILENFDPRPIHSLIWSAKSVLWDLHKHDENPLIRKITDSEELFVKPEHRKLWHKHMNKGANFLKHADNDPNDSIENIDFRGANELTFVLCALALGNFGKLNGLVAAGFTYCGFRSGNWLDFEGLCRIQSVDESSFEYYRTLSVDELRTELLINSRKLFSAHWSDVCCIEVSDLDKNPLVEQLKQEALG